MMKFLFLVSNKWIHERGQEFRRPCNLEREVSEEESWPLPINDIIPFVINDSILKIKNSLPFLSKKTTFIVNINSKKHP